ncbi:hypothetical protein DOE52_04775 [Porphyromonas gingivalis]|nr:hypothetical protein CS387_09795 [Porphyromonas gingivalis]PDP65682.1 hypothetical protein CLI78_08500 [Porphyromonas gingivalis]RRG13869.1 hypothetical protein DOE52_04775 [Porphyromonas gingivalis]
MGLLLWFFHRFSVFQIRRVLRPQKSHKERLIRKNSRKGIFFLKQKKFLTKNFSSGYRSAEKLYKNTGMSAVIPFNCSNNHTTDHFGREDAIVRRENLQIQYEIIEELGLPEHRHQDIPVDQKIRFTDVQTQYKYDKPLRHIAVFNQESGQRW